METVKGNHRFGEAGTDNPVHAVGEVKLRHDIVVFCVKPATATYMQ